MYLLYLRVLYQIRGFMMVALPTALRAHAMTFRPSGTQSQGFGLIFCYCALAHGGKLWARQDDIRIGMMTAPLCTGADTLLYAGVETKLRPSYS